MNNMYTSMVSAIKNIVNSIERNWTGKKKDLYEVDSETVYTEQLKKYCNKPSPMLDSLDRLMEEFNRGHIVGHKEGRKLGYRLAMTDIRDMILTRTESQFMKQIKNILKIKDNDAKTRKRTKKVKPTKTTKSVRKGKTRATKTKAKRSTKPATK
jgi:hypothetical protein